MRKIRYIGIVFLFIVFLCGFRSEEKKVYDDAGLFTEDQIENLQRKCVETAQEKEVDIIVVTADDEMGDKDWTSYADDFYDEHGFGYEKEQGTGILLLIDMKNRQICISTCEEAITYFTDARIDNMLDEIYEYLKDGEYYEGSMIFVDQVKTYMGVSPKKGSDLREPGFGEKMLTRMPFCLIISLAVAGIAVGCMHVSRGGKMTVDSHTYLKNNRVDVKDRRDVFLRTVTTTRKIDTDSGHGGGGGSSVHRSSGGVSHGGGSRGF